MKKANLGITHLGTVFVGDILKDGITVSSKARSIDESNFLNVMVEFLRHKIGDKRALKVENSEYECVIEIKYKKKEN
ncbi:MAG: hypothetical protein ACRC92_14140 [Peptostreptococcaceae bacterium]